MNNNALMYALQGLSEPYLENHYGGRDSSMELSKEEKDQIIHHRLDHKMLPKISEEELMNRSNDYFGEGAELPYAVNGEDGLEERIKVISLA
jgi:hypothetical protein